MKTITRTISVANLVLALAVSAAWSQESEVDPQLKSHINLLNELTDRRRVNTFFTNEQSLFYGVQVGYVNSSRGNLTFARRDLVTVGRIPVVVARVYDSSRLDQPSDFSPGWFLSLAETIVDNGDGTMTYHDDSASDWLLTSSLAGHDLQPPHISNISQINTLNSNTIQIVFRNHWSKRFERLGDGFRMTQVIDNNGNELNLGFTGDRLTRVDGQNGRYVIFTRDANGRITSVTDDQLRQVTYQYDNQNQLIAVTDLSGRPWTYQYYTTSGLLHKAVDPKAQIALAVTWHQDGKAKHTKVRAQKHTYAYNGATTEIKDPYDQITLINHNSVGAVARLQNPEGFVSEVVMDGQNRVSTLKHNGSPRANFSYDAQGNIDAMQRFDDAGAVSLTYSYDWKNNVVQVNGTDGTSLTMHYDARGNLLEKDDKGALTSYIYTTQGEVASKVKNGETVHYSYNGDGLTTTITDNNGTSQLAYNSIGRMSQVTFANGAVHTYQYDSQGFRTRTERSDGAYIDYQYDATGNLVNLAGQDAEGNLEGQSIETDEDNKVTSIDFDGAYQLQITYDDTGQPIAIDNNTVLTEYHYDRIGRLVSVKAGDDEPLTYEYRAAEPDIRLTLDDRTKATRRSGRVGQLGETEAIWYTRLLGSAWGRVGMDPDTLALTLVTAEGFSVADAVHVSAEQRRRWRDLAAGEVHNRIAFDKPSSSLFLPAEYATVNCAIYCFSVPPIAIIQPGEVFAGEPKYINAFPLVPPPYGCIMDYNWRVDGNFVWSAGSSAGALLYTFPSSGSYSVDAIGKCFGCLLFQVQIASVNVTVADPCSGAALDTFGEDYVTGLALRQFERGATFYCTGSDIDHRGTRSSGVDKCKINVGTQSGDIGWGHTHPIFVVSGEEFLCDGVLVTINNQTTANTFNINGELFSPADKAKSSSSYPGYLKTSLGNFKKCPGDC